MSLSIIMKNDHGDTPLHEACICGNVDIVKELLRHDADVNAWNKDGINPLETACMENHVEVVQAILNHNPSLAVPSNLEVTPIHIAAGQGYVDIANALLDCNDSFKDLLDNQHMSPLHYAARYNQVQMIQLLLFK